MVSTLIGALPGAVVAPITAVLATVDGRFLFAMLWAFAALAVGAIVRSALARTDARHRPTVRIVVSPRRIRPRAA
jgi:hypothetical protein